MFRHASASKDLLIYTKSSFELPIHKAFARLIAHFIFLQGFCPLKAEFTPPQATSVSRSP
jgi:hypothetical protein